MHACIHECMYIHISIDINLHNHLHVYQHTRCTHTSGYKHRMMDNIGTRVHTHILT